MAMAAARSAALPDGPRLGLALGGGLPFGAAAIGVLDVLERHSLPPACIAGTSMGSIVGLLYAFGYTPAQLEAHFEAFFKTKRLVSVLLRDLRPSRSGFVQGKEVLRAISALVPEGVCFEDLRMPFAVPAACLRTGQEIVFRSGPVLPAVRASISMPGIFTPVEWGGTYLVDGAVISPVPVHILPLLGADVVVPVRAVRAHPPGPRQRIADVRDIDGSAPHVAPPGLLQLIWRSLSLLLQDQFAALVMSQYPLRIMPEIPADDASNTHKVGAIIELGRRAAELQIDAIRAALRTVRSPRDVTPGAASSERLVT